MPMFEQLHQHVTLQCDVLIRVVLAKNQCYTSKVVKDILVAGIADTDIRKDVLGHPNLDTMLDKDIVKFVEEKEMAKNAVSATSRSDVNAMSNY